MKSKIVILISMMMSLQACDTVKKIINYKQKDVIEGEREAIYPSLQPTNTVNLINLSMPPSSISVNFSNYTPHNINLALEDVGKKSNKSVKKYIISKRFYGLAVTSPVIHDDIIYLIDGRGILSARNINNPEKTIWAYSTNNIVGKEKAISGSGMILDENYIYVASGTDKALKIDLNGKKIWEKTLNNSTFVTPVISKNHIYYTTIDNKLYALDKNTGEVRWGHETVNTPAITNKQAMSTIYKDRLIVPFTSGELNIFTLEGKSLWDKMLADDSFNQIASGSCDIEITPVVSDNIIYAVGNTGIIKAINLENGKIIWEKIINSASAILLYKDYLFVASKTGWLSIFDKSTGNIVSQYQTLNSKNTINQLFVSNSTLNVLINTGEIFKIDLEHMQVISPKIKDDKNTAISFYKNKIILWNNYGELIIN